MKKNIITQYFDKSQELHIDNKDYVDQFVTLFKWFLNADQIESDVSTKLVLDGSPIKKIKAKIIAKEKGILAGIEEIIFFLKNKSKIDIIEFKKDGSHINHDEAILLISGYAPDILAYERIILNVLSRMSGIATMTNLLIVKNKLIKGPYLAATRKTPWMWLDKKAVSVGGGLTHRLSLADGILIKDNHLSLISKSRMKSLRVILSSATKINRPAKQFEVEVESQNEAIFLVESYLDKNISQPLMVMLDNFSANEAKKTITALKIMVKKLQKQIIIELSGGISKKNLKNYAQLEADVISLGELTHSPKALSLSLSIIS